MRAIARHGIRKTYDAAHPEQVERATTGSNSYGRIHAHAREIAAGTGVLFRTAVGVLAVISPVILWEDNLAEAWRLCAGRPGKLSALATNVAKARRLLAGESALDVIRGAKVWSFYLSILNPDNPVSVCVDRHVARAAFGWEMAWRDVDKVLKRPGVYRMVADEVRAEAKERGVRALDLQSVLWLVMRENVYQGRLF